MEKRKIGSGRWVRREIGFKTLTEEMFTEGLGIESDVAPNGIDISRRGRRGGRGNPTNLRKDRKEKKGAGVDVHRKSR